MKQLKTTRFLAGVLFVAVTAPQGALAQPSFSGFALPILIETGKVPVHVKAMDLNDDGKLDLVVANRGVWNDSNSPPSIQTFISDGMGGFTPGQMFNSPDVLQPRHMVTGFLNADNLLDMVVADGLGNRIVSFVQAPGGGFLPFPQPFVVSPMQGLVMSVDLGQINGDLLNGGDIFLDVVTGNLANAANGPIARFLGDGNGAFGLASLFDEGNSVWPTVFLTLADRDGDGVIDQAVSVQAPLGSGLITDPFGAVTMTDVNFGTPNEFGGSISISAETRTVPVRPNVVRIANLDGDPLANDLVIPANGVAPKTHPDMLGTSIYVAFDGANDGSIFTNHMEYPTAIYPFDVAVVDINGDTLMDFVVTHRNSSSEIDLNDPEGSIDISVLINDGEGGFIDLFQYTYDDLTPQANPDLTVSPRFVELVDIDGDGDLDIVTTRTRNAGSLVNQPNGHISIFRNLTILNADLNGDGVVDAADLAILLSNWGTCTCFSDIDGDGDVDAADNAILLANWGPQAAMAPPGEMAFDDTTIIKDGAGAIQPNQNVTATVPWVVAHFGFDSVESYIGWIELLTEAELFNHIAAMLDLITGN